MTQTPSPAIERPSPRAQPPVNVYEAGRRRAGSFSRSDGRVTADNDALTNEASSGSDRRPVDAGRHPRDADLDRLPPGRPDPPAAGGERPEPHAGRDRVARLAVLR